MLNEVTLKDALMAVADGEKVLMINTNSGTVTTMEELLKPIFQNGIRFLQDTPEDKKKKASTGKRPGRKPGRKPASEKQAASQSSDHEMERSHSENGSGNQEENVDSDGENHGPPMNKSVIPAKQHPVKKSRFIALNDNTDAVKVAVRALAMNKTQKEIASMLGVSQPTISKIAATYRREIADYRTKLCKSQELPQSAIDNLIKHQSDPDDGTRKCGTCIYGSKIANGSCSYALVEEKPRGCVPWRCYRYRDATPQSLLQAAN